MNAERPKRNWVAPVCAFGLGWGLLPFLAASDRQLTLWAACSLLGLFVFAVAMGLRALWRCWQRGRQVLEMAELEVLKVTWGKRVVRHRGSGQIGLCVGLGFGSDVRWPWYRRFFHKPILIVVWCPSCAAGVLQGMPLIYADQARHMGSWFLSDCAAALEQEAMEFRAAGKRKGGAQQ